MKHSSPESYQLLHDGQLALAEVERAGVRVDKEYLAEADRGVKERIALLHATMKKDRIWKLIQREFGGRARINNRDQLSHVLFDKLKYKVKEWTAGGREGKEKKPSTTKAALEHIGEEYVRHFHRADSLGTKVLSTYFKGIDREMVEVNGFWYVHPSYMLNTASTYRSSCKDPNFQNIPKRDEEMARMVRRAYLPHPGHHMAEIDFSTLEVRIGHCYHQDPVMDRYLRDPSKDMHRDSAAELFMLDTEYLRENKDWAKKTVRDSAKNQFVFPEFFGSVWFQCAKEIWESMNLKGWKLPSGKPVVKHLEEKGIKGLGPCEAKADSQPGTFAHHVKQVEKRLWDRFKVYNEWRRSWYRQYQERGWFEMKTGFVVHTHHRRNDVINYPVQGSAFHCLLWCLIRMVAWLRKHKMRSRVIGEIHDCLVMSIHPAELQDVLNYAKWLMTVSLPRNWTWITCPLETESDVAPVDEPWSEEKLWVPDGSGTWHQAA